MVNVETVHTRYVTNINDFLQAADRVVLDKFSDSIADWMKDDEREPDPAAADRFKPKGPAEGGWVVEIRGYTDHNGGPTFVRQALLRNLQRFDDFAKKGKGDEKVGQYIVDVQDPVKGKVSHAFVYRVFAPNSDPQPNAFFNINRGSFLDAIVGGGGSPQGDAAAPPGAAPMGPGGPAAATPATAIGPDWTGLGRSGGKVTNQGGESPTSTKGEGTRRRHEFVVMLVWREPTPSAQAAPPPAP